MIHAIGSAWVGAIDFLGNAEAWPRWLRRIYILTLPVSWPLSTACFGVVLIAGMIVFAVVAPLIWLREAADDGAQEFRLWLRDMWARP